MKRINTKDQLIGFLQSSSASLRSFGVASISLFGSFASDTANDSSDIDLLVEFTSEGYNYSNFISLAYFIEENTGRKVDLLTKNSLSPHIGPHILTHLHHVALSA